MLKFDAVGISKVKWMDEQDFWSDEYCIIKRNQSVGLQE